MHPPDRSIDTHPAAVVLRVRGDVDLSTAPVVRTALRAAAGHGHDVVVDLGALASMDGSGFRAPGRAEGQP